MSRQWLSAAPVVFLAVTIWVVGFAVGLTAGGPANEPKNAVLVAATPEGVKVYRIDTKIVPQFVAVYNGRVEVLR